MLNNIKKFSLPDIEEKVLELWKTNNVFKKTKEKNKDKEDFVFYEGPPTANGRPGIHHVLSRSFKDIVLRFQTMKGKNVIRRGGWDTHGLPVELEVEKNLGVNSKDEIEEYGVEKFNMKCKESVWKYKDEWEKLTKRMGFWVDMDHPYITYENSYIDSLWWVISEINKKGYLYKGHKVVPWCPRCGTTLSSHELAQGYKEVSEPSVFMKFKLSKGQEFDGFDTDTDIYVLSWTTTPWTLPGNIALAVGKDITYALVEHKEERYVLAEPLLKSVFGDDKYKTVASFNADEIIGLSYEPLFPIKTFQEEEKAYKIYDADFVTTEDGTGVVHTAVMYGEDDYELGEKIGLPQYHTVDEAGKFKDDVSFLEGDFVKSNKAEKKIFKHLKENNTLFRTEDYTHEYPFCWRCDTPVLYYGQESWFIEVSKLRDKMLKANDDINWTPEHIKDGRFGEWLKGAKDWAISRERYWGTPLPIWQCSDCDNMKVIGGFEDLSEARGGSKNNYILMRHGQAQHNKSGIIDGSPDALDAVSLTEKGEKDIKKTAKKLKSEKIDLIFASDFKRTKDTANIIADELDKKVVLDERLREIYLGDFNGQDNKKYHDFFNSIQEKFSKTPPNGENLRDLTKRLSDFIEEIEEKHKGKNILIVSHEYPLWMLETVMRGWGEEDSTMKKEERGYEFINPGEFEKVDLLNLPKNRFGIVDPHRPYVDDVEFKCDECDGNMKRVEEVMDVWFDSGAMPFAQAHFPFENKKSLNYPAEYITEAIDQTRGWFYTLLATATLLGKKAPYKNVICLGLVLDENGKKMSKSKGNTVDPWDMAEKHGMDIVRWYFYTVNSPGEPKLFNEDELRKVSHNFVNTFYNSFKFLNIYRDKSISFDKELPKENVLDRWIISRLDQTIEIVTNHLHGYSIGGAARIIEELVSDLSRWYIRRSRARFQDPETDKEFEDASYVLSYALIEISKLLSPFTPFLSEAMYQTMKDLVHDYDFKDSVHMDDWPDPYSTYNEELIENMVLVREAASIGLSQREKAEIKVRQPLKSMTLKSKKLKKEKELLEVLKEEVNVKDILFDEKIESEVELDTKITKELKEEGQLRDIFRTIQGMRKSAGLEPGESIVLGIETDDKFRKILRNYSEELKSKVDASDVEYKPIKNFDIEKETTLGDHSLKITLRKT